jgi:internalin A
MRKAELLQIIKQKYFEKGGKELDLSGLPLGKLPAEIGRLKKLEWLKVEGTQLTTLPRKIGQLKKLKRLHVWINQLTTLPAEMGRLESLQVLNAWNNNLINLPPEIGDLQNLRSLYLGTNQLTSLPPEIGKLHNLVELELDNNHLTSLPYEITGLKKLQRLDLRGNPLRIPPEVLARYYDEPKTLLNYYFTVTEKSRQQLNEVKVLLIGQGSVGKTSLVQRILYGAFDPGQNKTEGISINQWEVGGSTRERYSLMTDEENPFSTIGQKHNPDPYGIFPIRLNIWDFGGQEIMHATHQFFLTKRSLYLLVLDARLTQEENRVEYWLKIIQSFGGESPVLIVGNKTDQHPLDLDRTGLQKKYPNIVGILETSAKSGAGIGTLKAKIVKQVDTMPHVRDLLPETWFTVKSKLEELGKNKNFISQDEYLSLCATNHVTDETGQQTLIGFLHDLGVVLHFQDDPRLAALGILNPQWVTNGVYKILNSHELFQNQGTLTVSLLNKILNLPEYPSNKRLFIVDMMKKFELCYDIEPDKSFLVPDLLPKDEIYTGEWKDALAFQYLYNVLPASIISRFIVRMNAFIHKNTIWRSGVVLNYSDNTALVKADIEDRKIYVWVNGKEETRRDLLAMIRGEFDAIHKTIAKIEVAAKVPLPNAPEADPIDLTFLQQMVIEGRESLPVKVGNEIIDLIAKEVLSRIEKEGKASQPNLVVQIDKMYGAIGNSNTINFIQQEFKPIYRAIEESFRDTTEKQDLISKVEEIKAEVAKGDQVNKSFLSRRLRNLRKMAPDIADVVLSALASPGTAISMIVKKVAKKIKEETGK